MKKAVCGVLILFLVAMVAFSACDDVKNNFIDEKIRFVSLTQKGDKVSGEVNYDITTFSFIDEIETSEGLEYSVSLDVYGKDVVPTKTVSLDYGNNTFYILVTFENQSKLYTVTIERKNPIVTTESDDSVVYTTDEGVYITTPSPQPTASPTTSPDKPSDDYYTWIEDSARTFVYVRVDMLNVRSDASVASNTLVGVIRFGESYTRVKYNSQWTVISYNGQNCYVSTAYLTTDSGSVLFDDIIPKTMYVNVEATLNLACWMLRPRTYRSGKSICTKRMGRVIGVCDRNRRHRRIEE